MGEILTNLCFYRRKKCITISSLLLWFIDFDPVAKQKCYHMEWMKKWHYFRYIRRSELEIPELGN